MVTDPRKLHYVGGHRLEIGPSYVTDVLVFSDEKQSGKEPYPTGEFTTFVSNEESWLDITNGFTYGGHDDATDDDLRVADYLESVSVKALGDYE